VVQVAEGGARCDGPKAAVVACSDLTKVYRRLLASRSKAVYALRRVSLSVHEGQIVGLIGPNGAGKSTLLNLVAGLIFPTEGQVSVCDHPSRSIAARRRLGYMPEHPVFPGRYSARAVLKYDGALLGLSAEATSEQVEKSIERLRLHDFIDRPAADFSQGMKQRLALAIALLGEPRLLLLDEPSNGLDPIRIVQLRDLLMHLRDAGTAVVISSHRLGELEKLTNHYLFMHRGQIMSFADKVAASHAGQLRVELVSDGCDIAKRLLPAEKVISASETELMIAVGEPDEIPEIVTRLAGDGARIMSVLLERESIEDVFVRSCSERTDQ
jgi:ABC-2 type transport system ATP-binding protein